MLGVPAETLAVWDPEDRQGADEALGVAMSQVGAAKVPRLQDLGRGIKTEVDV